MDRQAPYSPLIIGAKKVISGSKEWQDFIGIVQEIIDHQLDDSHIPDFADLSAEEKLLFIDKALHSAQSADKYKNLYSQVSLVLDQQVNNAVIKELQLSSTRDSDSTKTELIVDQLRENSVSLLRRWPDMKYKLHMYLNLPISPKLQSVAWKFFMSDKKVREAYDKLINSPRKPISSRDKQISETCEQILKLQTTFPDIGPPSIGAFYAMKAVLSYFHSQMKTDAALHHVYYLLSLPFLQLLTKDLGKVQLAANNIVASLVEMYITFINGLPDYVADVHAIPDVYLRVSVTKVHEMARRTFTLQVARHLLSYNSVETAVSVSLTNHLITLPVTAEYGLSSAPSAQDDVSRGEQLANVLLEVVSSLLSSLFVGFLDKDLLMFVWDQYVIGLDVAGYHAHFLSAFTASLFLLLHNDIRRCKDRIELLSVIQKESRKLTVSQVQQKIRKHHYKVLYNELNQDDKAAVPVIDPTQVTSRNWTHWNNELVPGRVEARQRQAARDARRAERERLLQMRQEEARNREKLANDQKLLEAQLRMDAELKRSQYEEERRLLQSQVEMERIKRLEKDRQYEDELSRLRNEIEVLKNQRLAAPLPEIRKTAATSAGTVRSYASALAPPPSRLTLVPDAYAPLVVGAPSRSRRSTSKDPSAEDIVHDLVSVVAEKFNNLAHGKGAERANLNESTRDDLTVHRQDVKYAELQVFGRYLKTGEFAAMEQREQTEKSDEMMDIIRTRLEERRYAELQSQIQ